MKALARLAATAAAVLALAGPAPWAVDLSGMAYLGEIDCGSIRQGSSFNDLVFANGELFLADYGGTVSGGRVYSIGLPAPGTTVTAVVRTLGGGDPQNPRSISYVAADDQVHWKYSQEYGLTYAQCEDAAGGNLENYDGGAPGDDRYQHVWGQGVGGRGMTCNKSGNGAGGSYGQYAYSWDYDFANQTNHGKMLCQATPSGSYPDCYDATIAEIFGTLSFLVINNDSYNGDSKRYMEAGEMTWDGSKYVVPSVSESIVDLGAYVTDFDAAGSPRLTVGGDKLYVLNASTSKIHVFQVPEPATMALLGLGFAGIALLRRRK